MAKPEGLFFIAAGPVRVVVRSETPALHSTAGQMIAPKQRRLYAQFIRSEAPAWAYEIGRARYGDELNGRPDVPIERWLGFYDTLDDQRRNGWTDEETVAIEERLLQSGSCTQVSPPKIEAPYPGYDSFKGGGKELAAKLVEDGYDLDKAIAYESDNKNRKTFIQAFEEASVVDVEDAVEEEVVA